MTQDRNALRAGTFIVGSVALVILIILAIKGLDSFVQPMQVRRIVFALTDDLGGLRVGDDVRIGGFKVGSVRSIDVIASGSGLEPDRIVISFAMPRKYVVREDAHVGIQGTLTGTSWINFESLGGGDALSPDAKLKGQASTSSKLMAELSAVAPEVRAILRDLRTKTVPAANDTLARFAQTADTFREAGTHGGELLQDLRGQLAPMMQKYHVMADRAAEMMVQIRDLIGDTKLDFRATVANLSAATGTLKQRMPGLMDRLDSVLVKLDESMRSVQSTLEDVRAVAANSKDLTAAVRSVITGNRGKLDSIIASVKTTADNLKGASAEVRRSPWRLLYKPAPNEMGNLNLFDSARQFAEGANTLSEASVALRDAVNNPQIDKAELEKLMQRVEQSFTQFHEVEQKLWKSVRE